MSFSISGSPHSKQSFNERAAEPGLGVSLMPVYLLHRSHHHSAILVVESRFVALPSQTRFDYS